MASDRIPFIDLQTEAKSAVVPRILAEIEELYHRSDFILGEKVAELEKQLARLAGTKDAVTVHSGFDALFLSLRALGIGPGDEVITAPNSFVASAAAIALTGARPVLVDVREDFNLDPEKIETALSARTKAILVVHLTGCPCEMDEIQEIAKRRGLRIVEDAAQAIGATYRGSPVGSLGNAGCFSLHPLKNLHVWGDGGFVSVDDARLAARLRMERNHGLKNRDEVTFFGHNSRMDTLQAIVALNFIPLLEDVIRQRRRNAQAYFSELSGMGDSLRLPKEPAGASSVYHVFQIRAKDRNGLRAHLLDRGIETKIHYPIPIHLQEAAQYLGHRRGDFPVTERLAEEILSLPVRENLPEEHLKRICQAVREYYAVSRIPFPARADKLQPPRTDERT